MDVSLALTEDLGADAVEGGAPGLNRGESSAVPQHAVGLADCLSHDRVMKGTTIEEGVELSIGKRKSLAYGTGRVESIANPEMISEVHRKAEFLDHRGNKPGLCGTRQ